MQKLDRTELSAISRGRRMAGVLRGIWQSPTPALTGENLSDLSEALQYDGLSGLIWGRLSPSARRTPLGRELRRGALADASAAARLDASLVEVLRTLYAVGVEPLVTKGWAVARYYASPGDRPYSDLDLAIRPDQAATARAALNKLGARAVDLHVGLPDLPQRTWPEVFKRSRVVPLNDVAVRILSPEDQFRWLTAHLVRHICCRPLWLIDLAAMLERVGPEMDWDLCLRGSFSWRRWTLAIVGLAEKLLDAPTPDGLRSRPGFRPPQWLVESTLWRWGGGNDVKGRALLRRHAEWRPFVAYGKVNPVRWLHRLELPPLRFLPPVWAAAIFGGGVLPFPRIWRSLFRSRVSNDAFVLHSQRVF